jgi:hypothetical protein
MREKGARSAFVALLFLVSLTLPQVPASPMIARPQASLVVDYGSAGMAAQPAAVSQTPLSSGPSPGTCFGYNGVNDSFIPEIASSLRIAVVKPIFTSTPYSQYNNGSFYAFYFKEKGVNTNVASNLDLLSTDISSGYRYYNGWGLSYGFYTFLTSKAAVDCGLVVGRNVQVLTDLNVSQGALFDAQNKAARFDVVVLPFSEYVTTQEYLAYEGFVAGGGTLVMMAHSLEYPVTYNATTNLETLVIGHGWAFNGKYASPVACSSDDYAACPWSKNSTDWIGSATCGASCYHVYTYNGSQSNGGDIIGRALSNEFGSTVFKPYVAHEEDVITNRTGTSVISTFVNDSRNFIASYTHQFRKGSVVCMCVFGDDIIARDASAQYFLLLGMASGRLGPAAVCSSALSGSDLACTATVVGWNPTGMVSWDSRANLSISPKMCTLTSGSCSVKILDAASVSFSATLIYFGDASNAPSSRPFAVTTLSFGTSTSSSTVQVSSTTFGSSSSTTIAPQPSGTYPTGLIAIGGLAAVVVVAAAVVLRRRQHSPGG